MSPARQKPRHTLRDKGRAIDAPRGLSPSQATSLPVSPRRKGPRLRYIPIGGRATWVAGLLAQDSNAGPRAFPRHESLSGSLRGGIVHYSCGHSPRLKRRLTLLLGSLFSPLKEHHRRAVKHSGIAARKPPKELARWRIRSWLATSLHTCAACWDRRRLCPAVRER